MGDDVEKRCDECSGELSCCGEMTADGPRMDCRYCLLELSNKDLLEEIAVLREKVKVYESLAHIAALCTMDLTANLNDANQEYMDGKISAGAFRYVRERHAAIHELLYACGYTVKHPIFDCPCKPSDLEKMKTEG